MSERTPEDLETDAIGTLLRTAGLIVELQRQIQPDQWQAIMGQIADADALKVELEIERYGLRAVSFRIATADAGGDETCLIRSVTAYPRTPAGAQ